MEDRIREAFEPIKASDSMKKSTIEYLRQQRTAKSPKPVTHSWRRQIVAACAILLLVLGAGYLYTVKAPISYVSIDVNPSIELALNRYDRVVSAKAYNEDGTIILSHLDVSGMYYTQAIDTIVESDAMQVYLTDDSALTFTVASGNTDKEAVILSGIAHCSGYTQHAGTYYSANIESLSEAHNYGMSFGKYAAYLILSQYDDSVTVEDCQDMNMGEIHRQISSHEGEGDSNCNSNGNGSGTGSGTGTGTGEHGNGRGQHGGNCDS